MNFFESLQHNINTQMVEFLKNISEKYDIEYDDIKNDWESYTKNKAIKKESNEKSPKKVNKEESPKSPKASDCNTCIYTFIKPPRKGEVCGTKIKGDSQYCSKHKPKEKKEKIEKDSPKEKIEKDSPKEKSPKPDPEKTLSIRINNKIGKFVHPLSGMVFFSKDEKVVYGKLVKDTVQELSETDIETCKKYGFKIDKSKFVQASAKSPSKQKIEKAEKETTKNIEDVEDDLED